VRNKIREIHGVADADKIGAVVSRGGEEVKVVDGVNTVYLCFQASNFHAGLSPDRARYIAECLSESAERVESSE
jgi:hypothetical protein